MSKFEDWFTNLCLDFYDWYTGNIAELQQDILHAKKLLEKTR